MILTRPIQLHTLKMFQVIRSLLLNILVALRELLQLMMFNKEPSVLRERPNLFLTATFQVTHISIWSTQVNLLKSRRVMWNQKLKVNHLWAITLILDIIPWLEFTVVCTKYLLEVRVMLEFATWPHLYSICRSYTQNEQLITWPSITCQLSQVVCKLSLPTQQCIVLATCE